MRTRPVIVAGLLAVILTGCGGSGSSAVHTDVDTGRSTTSSTTAATSTTTRAPTTTAAPSTTAPTTTAPPAPPPTTVTPDLSSPSEPSAADALAVARARGVPDADHAQVVLSGCWGRTSSQHWGYYHWFDDPNPVVEPDGVVVDPGVICLNPSQRSPYSTLVHEMAHEWFWERSIAGQLTGDHELWYRTVAEYGDYQVVAECFAKIWGATVFGAGGCPAWAEAKMRAEFGW